MTSDTAAGFVGRLFVCLLRGGTLGEGGGKMYLLFYDWHKCVSKCTWPPDIFFCAIFMSLGNEVVFIHFSYCLWDRYCLIAAVHCLWDRYCLIAAVLCVVG